VDYPTFVFSAASTGWRVGKHKAKGQNFARMLMEAPSNLMTPKIFTDTVHDMLDKKDNVKVIIR